MRLLRPTGAILAFALACLTQPAASAGTILQGVQQRGVVRCSVATASGFAAHDESGRPVGLMVDFCRAIAAAALGNAEAVELRHFPRAKDYDAVENHDVDVSFSMNSWSLGRDGTHKIDFGPVLFYDSQGFATWSAGPAAPARTRTEATVCVTAGSSAKRNLETMIRTQGLKWTLRSGNSWEETLQAFLSRDCSLVAADHAVLMTALKTLRQPGDAIAITPDTLSREALSPVIAAGDHQWQLIVRWTMFALILAEEKGIGKANAADKRTGGDLETRRLLAGIPSVGAKLGLADDWAFQVISQVGNYGEIFERNLGKGSAFLLDRGLNKPWDQGGLLYAPPFQ